MEEKEKYILSHSDSGAQSGAGDAVPEYGFIVISLYVLSLAAGVAVSLVPIIY